MHKKSRWEEKKKKRLTEGQMKKNSTSDHTKLRETAIETIDSPK